jgi:hypothetical protein
MAAGAIIALLLVSALPALTVSRSAFGQGAAGGRCTLVPDDRNRSEKVLRCGDQLTIRAAPNTRYQLQSSEPASDLPSGAVLDVGALLIEFQPSETRRSFQILTPHAIAAVRGTKWAMEVENDVTSTLVVFGFVEVRRPDASRGSLLRAGQGADVMAGSGPVIVKRWPRPRVDALLARFGN